MAQKVRIIRLAWENEDSFKMDVNLDGGDWKKIVEADENGHLADLWPEYEATCRKYFDAELAVIGSEMKA